MQEQRRRPLFFRCFPLFWLEKFQEPQKGTNTGDRFIAQSAETPHTRKRYHNEGQLPMLFLHVWITICGVDTAATSSIILVS
jgi:hypothetical protein